VKGLRQDPSFLAQMPSQHPCLILIVHHMIPGTNEVKTEEPRSFWIIAPYSSVERRAVREVGAKYGENELEIAQLPSQAESPQVRSVEEKRHET
jgi:hypothetical protein